MVDVRLHDETVVIDLRGWHKLWALRSQLLIPLTQLRGVYADPTVELRSSGLRFPGTFIPGIIKAGTFYQGGHRSFWAVRDPRQAIVFELVDHAYDFVIVEVQEPAVTVRQVWSALHAHRGV